MLDIRQIPVLSDNFIYLVREPASGAVAVVDPAVSAPVLAEAARLGWKITHILNTHHHPDHVGGNMEIKEATGCVIVGPGHDPDRIPGMDVQVKDGETGGDAQRVEAAGEAFGRLELGLEPPPRDPYF